MRRGVPEWLLAAVLSIRARTWAILAMWLVAYRFTIMHGWGAVFGARQPVHALTFSCSCVRLCMSGAIE